MRKTFDLIFKNGILADGVRQEMADIAICDGVIAARGALDEAKADKVIDASGLHIIAGAIDTQTHFREPHISKNEPAETLHTGSKAALLGGITGIFEMPNTFPPTIDQKTLDDKLARANNQMFCDYAFYIGGVAQNVEILPALERQKGVCGIKVFMGSSTGNLLTADDKTLFDILSHIQRPIAFHAEDEYRLNARKPFRRLGEVQSHVEWRDERSALLATQRILKLARLAKKTIHILHVSTASEMALLAKNRDIASVEVTPQHLTLSAPVCYERLGSLAQMNPPIRSERHQQALWRGVKEGVVDIIGSDHAPHLLSEKNKPYPESPSGMAGVQTLLPIMLTHVNQGRLSLERLIELVSSAPKRIFSIQKRDGLKIGAQASLTIIDMKMERHITNDWIVSPCGWTVFDGFKAQGFPKGVVLNGRLAMWEDEILAPALGAILQFEK